MKQMLTDLSRAASIFRGALYASALPLRLTVLNKEPNTKDQKPVPFQRLQKVWLSVETKAGIFDKICGKQKKSCNPI